MRKKLLSLENVSPFDTRSDTTYKGYNERHIPRGAALGPAGDSPLVILDILNDSNYGKDNPYNPNHDPSYAKPIMGVAPSVGIAKARNAVEALEMIKAMKAAKQAKSIAKASSVAKHTTNNITQEAMDARIAKSLETRRLNMAKLSQAELDAKKAAKIAKIKAKAEAKRNNSWKHINRSEQYTLDELIDAGLNKEDLSNSIITKRGGNRWVSSRQYKYGGRSVSLKRSLEDGGKKED